MNRNAIVWGETWKVVILMCNNVAGITRKPPQAHPIPDKSSTTGIQQDKVPDTEVQSRADMPSIHTLLGKNQLRWAGNVVRMDDDRLPKQLFYSELASGKRSTGGQYKRYKDTLKANPKSLKIDVNSWETAAQERTTWRSSLHKGASHHENARVELAQKKRAVRKQRQQNKDMPPAATDPMCPTCGRRFRARIGLISHSRAHHRTED